MTKATPRPPATARKRLLVALLISVVVATGVSLLGAIPFAPLAAWDTLALVYGCWTWLAVVPMDAASTKLHAVNENPGRAMADTLLLLASLASLVAVVVLLIQSGNDNGVEKGTSLALGLVSVVISWTIVHTTYALSYARQYYSAPEGGVDFGQRADPRYTDFAYLAFTIGMTFQVSDTNLTNPRMRAIALKQALLSYLFGTVIIATTISTLASLSK
jgi:uncharacterized membrane protein